MKRRNDATRAHCDAVVCVDARPLRVPLLFLVVLDIHGTVGDGLTGHGGMLWFGVRELPLG